MSDISNRTIVALLAVALVVSVAGTMYSVSELGQVSMVFRTVSGLADNDVGNVTLNLSGTVGLQVIRDQANVGTGFVKTGQDKCVFSTGGASSSPQAFSVNSTNIYDDLNGNSLGVNNQNADNGNCGGPDFNNSIKRQDGVHVLENTGNVDIMIGAQIDATSGSLAGATQNTCAFLTGYGDSDGSNGCSASSGSSTRADVPVSMGLYTLSASTSNNPEVDGADDSLPTDVDDTHQSVTLEGELLSITDLNASLQQLANDVAWENHNDELAVGFSFVIPSDAAPGLREMRSRYMAQQS